MYHLRRFMFLKTIQASVEDIIRFTLDLRGFMFTHSFMSGGNCKRIPLTGGLTGGTCEGYGRDDGRDS